jgi:dienelactone hydrolase
MTRSTKTEIRRRPGAAALLLATLAAMPAAAGPPTLHDLPAPAGMAQLLRPEGDRQVPLVVLLPDALGDDGRSSPYVAALERNGIASLVLGLGLASERGGPERDPASSTHAAGVAMAWAATQPGFATAQMGVLGLGAGGRAALAAAEAGGPVVAVDPGCTGLAVPEWMPALVVFGRAAPDAADCLALEEPPAGVIRGMPGLGHGWDVRPELGPGDSLLPDPLGGRRRVSPNPAAAQAVADQVAAWLAHQFAMRGERP